MSTHKLGSVAGELAIFNQNPAIADKGTTVRSSTTALFTISSQDRAKTMDELRLAKGTSYDFTIVRPTNVLSGFFTRLSVSEISFQLTIPNINEKTNKIDFVWYYNNIFNYDTLVIDIGFKTPREIADAIETEIQAINPVLALATFKYGLNDIPSFTWDTTACPPDGLGNLPEIGFFAMRPNTIDYPFNADSTQLFDLLGFTGDLGFVTPGYGTPTTISAYQENTTTFCNPNPYFDIVCTQLTGNQGLKDGSTQDNVPTALSRVYVAQNSNTQILPSDPDFCPVGCAPTTIYINYANPKVIQWQPNQNVAGYLRFQVLDDSGNVIDYGATNQLVNNVIDEVPNLKAYNNLWCMTILVSEQ